MQKISALLGCLLVITSACRPVDSPVNLTDEDYRVYSAYLRAFPFYRNVPPAQPILLADSTFMPPASIGAIHPQTTWAWVTANLGDRCRYEKDNVRCRKARDSVWIPLFETVKYMAPARQVALIPARLSVPYPVQSYAWAKRNAIDLEQSRASQSYYII